MDSRLSIERLLIVVSRFFGYFRFFLDSCEDWWWKIRVVAKVPNGRTFSTLLLDLGSITLSTISTVCRLDNGEF
jgi:hypothetical protein